PLHLQDIGQRQVLGARTPPGLTYLASHQLERHACALLDAPDALGRPVGLLVGQEDAHRGSAHHQTKRHRDHQLNQAQPDGPARQTVGNTSVHIRVRVVTCWLVSPSVPRPSFHWTVTVQSRASPPPTATQLIAPHASSPSVCFRPCSHAARSFSASDPPTIAWHWSAVS